MDASVESRNEPQQGSHDSGLDRREQDVDELLGALGEFVCDDVEEVAVDRRFCRTQFRERLSCQSESFSRFKRGDPGRAAAIADHGEFADDVTRPTNR